MTPIYIIVSFLFFRQEACLNRKLNRHNYPYTFSVALTCKCIGDLVKTPCLYDKYPKILKK